MTRYALGLDGGGTQTRAAVATSDGAAIGRGHAGACNLAAVPLPDALAAALAAAEEALAGAGAGRSEVGVVCAGVAGTSFEQRRAEFQEGLQAAFPSAEVSVEPDYAVALTGATGGDAGMIVIAGTGSAAYGENQTGASHKTGGYGYLIDDAGSGYGVGRAALAAVLRAADGTGAATTLADRLPPLLGIASLADIVPGVYGGGIGRVAIAALAQAVADAAREDNDAVARALLMRAGGALAHLAHGITSLLFAADAPFPIALIGGLWNAGDPLIDVFTRSLRRFAPAAVVISPQHSPVDGAAIRAAWRLSDSEKSPASS